MKELNLFCFITNLVISILCGILLPIVPQLTRKAYLFGVKIPSSEQDCPEAKQMKKRYVTICLSGSVVTLVLSIVQYIIAPDITLIATMYFPILLILIYMAAYIPNWKQSVQLKESRKWEVSNAVFAETKSSYSRGNLSALAWGWYIVMLLLIFIFTVAALMEYPNMPDIIPAHYDLNFEPDAWRDKSLGFVLTFPILSLLMAAILLLIGLMFEKAKLQIDPANPALSFAQHRMYRRQMGHCLGFVSLSVIVTFLLIGMRMVWLDSGGPIWNWMPFLPWIIPCVVLYIVNHRAGQGGCKLKPKLTNFDVSGEKAHKLSVGRGDDKYWVLGMFYYNPDDPAHVVEDRFGNGLGFNYSCLSVKIGVILTLLAIIAGYAWITVWLCSIT